MRVAVGLSDALVRDLVVRARGDAPRDEIAFGVQGGFHKPLSRRALDKAETHLGFELPPAVRDMYGRVANGGFGPGYGVIGLVGGALTDLKNDAANEYRLRHQRDEWDDGPEWPDALLPIVHWGCAIYSCVDCAEPTTRIVRFDPNPVDDDWSIAWGDEGYTLDAWLTAWLAGTELFVSGAPPNAYPDA